MVNVILCDGQLAFHQIVKFELVFNGAGGTKTQNPRKLLCQSGKILIEMGKILGHEEDTEWLVDEVKMLTSVLNDKLWCEEDAYYYDMWRTGLNGVKSIGA